MIKEKTRIFIDLYGTFLDDNNGSLKPVLSMAKFTKRCKVSRSILMEKNKPLKEHIDV